MGVSARTLQYLADNEVLTFEQKLIDYVETDTGNKITDNMRCLPMITDHSNAAQMIHQEAFVLSAKSLGSLRIAAVVVQLFRMTYCPLSADIMMYDSRLKNFKVHMDAIKYKKENDTYDPHKLSSNLPIEDYIKGLDVSLGCKIKAMNCPMIWVTRQNVLAPAAAPPMAHNQPYSIGHVSVSEEMVQRYFHRHTLYATENASVYDLLDTALRGTKYHATIATVKRRRDVRGAYLALNEQFCGPALWDKMF